MTRLSSLIILSATALALSSPALAKTSIQKGENLCKAEIAKLEPAPKSPRVDKEGAKASNATFVFDVKARSANGDSVKLTCTVDRETDTASVALLSPLGNQQQQAAQ
jgi:hypothetical protein